jgi:hypothetical protein
MLDSWSCEIRNPFDGGVRTCAESHGKLSDRLPPTRRHVRRHDTFRDVFFLALGTQHELAVRAPKDGQSGAGVCASQDVSS